MSIKVFRAFILLLIVGMVTPIYLFNDNVLRDQAITQKNYSYCEQINYALLFYQCIDAVRETKAVACKTDSLCLRNLDDEKSRSYSARSSSLSTRLESYQAIFLTFFISMIFLFLVKGRWISHFPAYQRFLEQVADIFPESDYFADRSFSAMTSVVFFMGLVMVLSLELSAIAYSYFYH